MEKKEKIEKKKIDNDKYPKVLIGVVTSIHKIYCLPNFLLGLKQIDYPNFDVLIVDNSPDTEYGNFVRSIQEAGYNIVHIKRAQYTRKSIVDSRNHAKKYFLDNPEYKYFLSLESDVIPPKDVIQQLMSNNVAIVSAVYLNGKVYRGVMSQEGKPTEIHTWIPMAWQYPVDGLRELSVLRPMDVKDDIVPSRLMAVQSTGVGCLLLRRDVLEKVKEFRYEKEAVACDDMYFCMDATKCCSNSKCDYTQDIFLHKCPKCGSESFKIWLNTYVWCKHFHKEWDGDAKLKR